MMEPRWDSSNKRWECSTGSGENRVWYRTKIPGEKGREVCLQKRENALYGPSDELEPGSLEEFIETVWWPRTKASSTKATMDGYKSVLRRAIAPFYSYQLEQLRLEVLQPWVSNSTKHPKTVHNEYRVMSGILQLAHLTGRYNRLDHKLVVLPEIEETWAVEGLEPENIAKILAAAKGTIFEGPIWSAAFLGLRRNEVCGLKKGHVKLEPTQAVITLQHNRQVGIETNKLKSKKRGATRVLTVPREMGERLLSFGAHDGLYVFHGIRGKPIHPNDITECMIPICAQAGAKHVAFKDLRSSCRSNLNAAGVDDVVCMAILGHSSMKTSLIYQDNRASRQVDAFARLLSG